MRDAENRKLMLDVCEGLEKLYFWHRDRYPGFFYLPPHHHPSSLPRPSPLNRLKRKIAE